MSFIYKTQDVDSQYKKILYAQKEIIQTNKYMRELEQKYQRYSKRHARSQIPKRNPISDIKTHDWPIESSMFTHILKQKLSSVIPTSQNGQYLSLSRRNISRPRTRNSEIPKMQSKVVMASNSFAFNQEHDIISMKNPRIVKKNSSEFPYSRLSLDNSVDIGNEDEVRDMHVVRIPRYY